MNRAISIILAVLLAVAAAFAIIAHSKLRERDDRIAQLERERDEAKRLGEKAARDTESLRTEADDTRKRIAEVTKERDEARVKAKSAPAAAVAAAAPAEKATEGGAFSGLADMMKTEEGKKMMRSQVEMMTKLQYTGLARKLKLSPKDAEQVLAMLGGRAADAAGNPFEFMEDGKMDAEAMKAMGEKSEKARAEYDEKLKAVLGPEKFAQLQDYEKTLGDRMMLTQIEPSFNVAGTPLTQDQKDKLLDIMTAERRKLPAPVFDGSGTDPAKDFNNLLQPGAVDRHIAQEEEFQRRVGEAAAGALNPDQVNALRDAFKQNMELQKFGMKMGAEMMKKGGDAGVIAAPAPAPAK